MDNKMTAFFVALAIIGVAANAAISVGQGPLQVSISPSQGAVIDSGQSYSFTAVPSGTSAYRYQWYNTTGVLPILMQGQHAAGLSLVAGALGSYSYQVRVLDSSGGSASASVALTVNPAPTVSLSTRGATLDSGEEYQLSASYLPGTGAPSYLWDVGSLGVGSGCAYPSDSVCNVSTSGVAPGSYRVSVTIKDNSSTPYASAPMRATINVNPAPSISVSSSGSTVAPGQLVSYTITVNGGTGPFNVTLYDSSGKAVESGSVPVPGSSVSISFIPSSTSSYSVSAQDLGTSGQYSFSSPAGGTAVVVPPSSSVTLVSAAVGTAAFVLAIVIAVAYYYTRSKKTR